MEKSGSRNFLLILLAAFSLARSFCSIASKDVLAKTVPAKRRGRLTGWSTSGAGLVSILVGRALLLSIVGLTGAWLSTQLREV